ncbi:MAG: cytidine deaminase [Bacteroidetes bacterium]|nr:MAG: cytidine deaminase [Bacteroidota bacterium]
MYQKSTATTLSVFASEGELSENLKEILIKARKNTENSYAPYSKFRVSCALQLTDGTLVMGSNQENIAYPSGLCAERVAIFAAGAQYPHTPPKVIAITATSEKGVVNHPPTSCGACLQVMAEYEKRFNTELTIVLSGESGEVYVAEGVKQFMPWSFASDLV